MGWEEKLERARRLHRPSLKNWERDGLYESFPDYQQAILDRPQYEHFLLQDSLPKNIPAVLDGRTLSTGSFARNYEAKQIPSVITSIPQQDEWTAVHNWKLENLEDDEDLRDRYFKCGEDDDGRSIKVKLKHFLKYVRRNRDDSPLYIFDSSFDDDRLAKKILTDYTVPSYCREDLFRLVSEQRRPPYRWFLVGPERSGTTVHIDPLATSAWNTLVQGKKRWVLFPPHTPKHVVKGKGLIRSDEDDEAIHYFMTILPRIKRRAHAVGSHGDYRDFACYEFTQNEGETVFIPNGWWHAVLNLTDTVGITQNFCSPRNFDHVWLKTRSGRKRMAYKWLCQLDEHYPDLAERARAMNVRDNFAMKYDPVEVARRKEEEQRRRRERRLREEEEERSRRDRKLHEKEKEHRWKERSFVKAESRRQVKEEQIRQCERKIMEAEEQRRSDEKRSSQHRNAQGNDVNGGACLMQSGSKRSRLDTRHVSPEVNLDYSR